jgi:GTP-binding protein HflX
MFRVALVGYTNAGKSSILRELSGAEVLVEDRLFATLDSATRHIDVGMGHEALLTDTVGFIRKLPHHLVASFRSTLEEAREADLLIHVVDASHPQWEEQMQVVDGVLEDLGLTEGERVLAFNKIDRLTHEEETVLRERIRTFEATPAVFVSAVESGGLEPLLETIRARVRARFPRVDIRIPLGDGHWLALLHREGEVLETRTEPPFMIVRARIPATLYGRLQQAKYLDLQEPPVDPMTIRSHPSTS